MNRKSLNLYGYTVALSWVTAVFAAAVTWVLQGRRRDWLRASLVARDGQFAPDDELLATSRNSENVATNKRTLQTMPAIHLTRFATSMLAVSLGSGALPSAAIADDLSGPYLFSLVPVSEPPDSADIAVPRMFVGRFWIRVVAPTPIGLGSEYQVPAGSLGELEVTCNGSRVATGDAIGNLGTIHGTAEPRNTTNYDGKPKKYYSVPVAQLKTTNDAVSMECKGLGFNLVYSAVLPRLGKSRVGANAQGLPATRYNEPSVQIELMDGEQRDVDIRRYHFVKLEKLADADLPTAVAGTAGAFREWKALQATVAERDRPKDPKTLICVIEGTGVDLHGKRFGDVEEFTLIFDEPTNSMSVAGSQIGDGKPVRVSGVRITHAAITGIFTRPGGGSMGGGRSNFVTLNRLDGTVALREGNLLRSGRCSLMGRRVY